MFGLSAARLARGSMTEVAAARTPFTSMWTLPAAPSPQTSMRWIFESLLAVGQTLESSAQVVVGSPVAELHLSVKDLKGMRTSTKSSPAGTENPALEQPRPPITAPPDAQDNCGLIVPAA